MMRHLLLIGTGSPSAAFLPFYVASLRPHSDINVRVCLSHSATRWVSSAALELLSGSPVASGDTNVPEVARHVEMSSWATHTVVVPATLAFCSSLAYGQSQSLATSTALSSASPLLLFPSLPGASMSGGPWSRVGRLLREDGHVVVDPVEGLSLTSAESEGGASPAPGVVLTHIRKFLETSPSAANN